MRRSTDVYRSQRGTRVGTLRFDHQGAVEAASLFVGAAPAAPCADPVTLALIGAGLLMTVGRYRHISERHDHEIRHVHDEHHIYERGPGDLPVNRTRIQLRRAD